MKEPTETQQGSHSIRAASLHLVLAWMLFNIASTATAAPPSIAYPPRSQTVILYQQAAFGVIASGSAPLSYQWRKDGVPIVGATNDQVVVAQAHFSDSGQYSVVVSNAEGSVTSAEAGLTVNPPKAGDVDFSFDLGGSINGNVESVAVQPDGKILIAGGFTTVHDAARGGIARLNANGSTDYTFMDGLSGASPPFNSIRPVVSSIALQSDGKVLIGGNFTMVNGVGRTNIARLNSDGTLESDFLISLAGVAGWESHYPTLVSSIAVQSDGKVLIEGSFSMVNGVPAAGIARLNADGTLDSGFRDGLTGAMLDHIVHSIAVQSDGKVLIGGYFSMVNGVIARLNADGSLDSAFQIGRKNDFLVGVYSVALQRDGKVLIGGEFTSFNGVRRNNFARLNSDGTLDIPFQNLLSGADYIVSSIAVQNDGKVLIGGSFGMVNGVPAAGIARLNADGTLDTAFQSALSRVDYGFNGLIAVQSDGKVLLGGFDSFARLNADGTLDSGFLNRLSEAGHIVYSVALQHDGKVLIGGWFDTVNGVSRNRIARLNADGTLDSGFLNGLSGAGSVDPRIYPPVVWSVAVQSDGKVLIGGGFTTINGAPRDGIARLNADGTLDSGFQSKLSGADHYYVSSITVQRDGKVLVGGWSAGETRIIFARLNADGTLDSGYQTKLSGADFYIVHSIAVQGDGKVLIGGWFDTVNGVSPKGIARLNADGTPDSGFQDGLTRADGTPSVSSIALQSDGKVLIGGGFTRVDDMGHPIIARLNADGTLDSGFQTELSGAGDLVRPPLVSSVVVQSDGKVLIGGHFSTVNGVSRNSIARLNADGSLDTGFQSGLSEPDDLNNHVESLAVQRDGKVLIGGRFDTVNGVSRNWIARLWGSADVPPRIQSVHRSGANANLTWDALPLRTYRVQYKATVSASNWTDLAADILTSAGTESKTDTTLGNASQRFYRVMLLP